MNLSSGLIKGVLIGGCSASGCMGCIAVDSNRKEFVPFPVLKKGGSKPAPKTILVQRGGTHKNDIKHTLQTLSYYFLRQFFVVGYSLGGFLLLIKRYYSIVTSNKQIKKRGSCNKAF